MTILLRQVVLPKPLLVLLQARLLSRMRRETHQVTFEFHLPGISITKNRNLPASGGNDQLPRAPPMGRSGNTSGKARILSPVDLEY
jgi:hypothetical protein